MISAYNRGNVIPKYVTVIPCQSTKLYVAQVSNGIAGPEAEAVSTSAATASNLFRYDADSDRYVFNWSTKALQTGVGTYQLRIDLGDGTTNTVFVSLR